MTAMTETRTDFSRLLRDRRAELGISLRALADTDDPEHLGSRPLTHQRIDRLEKNPPKITPPSPAELRTLAAGLRISLHALQSAAAAQYFGLESAYSADHAALALIPGWDEMTEAERAQLRAIIDAFAAARRRGNDGGGSTQ